jgi:hypothetical protein
MDKIASNEKVVNNDFTLNAIHLVNQDGKSVDIGSLVQGFRLYESIYTKFVTADITLLDAVNLLKHYALTGQEFVRISFMHGNTEDNSEEVPIIDKTFRVYKVINITRIKETVQAYQLKLCEPQMVNSKTTRIEKVYRGSHSKMLNDVITKEMVVKDQEIEHWEDSEYDNHQFVAPRTMSANKFIDYITSIAGKGKSSSFKNPFFFYQTLMGGFNFKSLDNMVSGNLEKTTFESQSSSSASASVPKGKVTESNSMREFPKLIFKPSTGADDAPLRTQIQSVSIPQKFDTLGGTIGGAYSSYQFSYDPISKIDMEDYYDMEETYGRAEKSHVSGKPMIRTERMLVEGGGQELGLTTENSTSGDKFEAPPVLTKNINNMLAPNRQMTGCVITDYSFKHGFDNSDKYDTDEVFRSGEVLGNSTLERRAMMEILQQNRIKITIPIRSDLQVGQVIELAIPEPEIMDEGSNTKDKINDNRYLLTDMMILGQPAEKLGHCNLELVKESYAKDTTKAEIESMNKSGSKTDDDKPVST